MTTASAPQRFADPAELARRLEAAGVPRRFMDGRFESFEPRKGTKAALDAARALGDDDDGRGLVLLGAPGTGKTHLAVAIVRARLERWLGRYPDEIREEPDPASEWHTRVIVRPFFLVRFLVVPTFLDQLRAAARYTDVDDPLPGLFAADLVVLDDLGREKATDWATERLYVLVNERYNRCLPTVVTSNFTVDELAASSHAALVSRLTDGADLVRIEADDYRRRRA